MLKHLSAKMSIMIGQSWQHLLHILTSSNIKYNSFRKFRKILRKATIRNQYLNFVSVLVHFRLFSEPSQLKTIKKGEANVRKDTEIL